MISCRDECGTRINDEIAAAIAGWSYLSITRSYRCGVCCRVLAAAFATVGREALASDCVDRLDPRSRGALPRETASGITAPTVGKSGS